MNDAMSSSSASAIAEADRDSAHMALEPAAERGDVACDAVHREQHAARMLEQRDARPASAATPRRERDSSGVPRSLSSCAMRLLIADGSMCSSSRRARDVPVLADRDEQAQRLQVDVAHAAIIAASDIPNRKLERFRNTLCGFGGMSKVRQRRRYDSARSDTETDACPRFPAHVVDPRSRPARRPAEHPDASCRPSARSNGSATPTPPASARSRSARSCRRACCRSSPTPPSCVAYAKTLPGLFVSVLVPNLKGAERAHRGRRRPDARAALREPRAQPRQPAQDARRGGRRGRRASAPRAMPPARRR